MPSLLHVYWILHVVHLALAALAVGSWYRKTKLCPFAKPSFRALLPWVCLALLLWIPGVYLEVPSDPITHWGRIVEWSHCLNITEHSTWRKFPYFLAYSMTYATGTEAFPWLLRAYYTGTCLLLFWQYYRLGLDLKLGAAAAFLMVLTQLLVFGNSAFSYHRYYGISSTVISQAAVIAAWRQALVFLEGPSSHRARAATVANLALLSILILFSHVQGALLAANGIAALVLWHLCARHRAALLALVVGLGILSVLIATRATFVAEQQAGWLNSWGAFAILDSSTAAHHRALELLGTVGVIAAFLGLVMFVRNHPGAWLMAVPWLFLLIPATAFPVAAYCRGSISGMISDFHGVGTDYLSVFSRQLMGMPLGLPFAWLTVELAKAPRWSRWSPAVPVATLALALGQTSGPYGYNRAWQALACTPSDLTLAALDESRDLLRHLTQDRIENKVLINPGAGYFLAQTGIRGVPYERKQITFPDLLPPSATQTQLVHYLEIYAPLQKITLVVLQPSAFFTPGSQAAATARHWLTYEAALNLSGGPELLSTVRAQNLQRTAACPGVEIWTNVSGRMPATLHP